MRKMLFLLTWIAFLSGEGLQAQQTGASVESATQAPQAGTAVASATQMGRSNEWQNWAFAGSAIATAAVGIFAVTLHNGASTAH